MIEIDVPGFGNLRLQHLVADFNGTLAIDGILLPEVAERLQRLGQALHVHVLTADTQGTARREIDAERATLVVIPEVSQADAKADYVRQLGADEVVAIGNGRNDRKMLRAAALGIAVIQREGGAVEALAHADVVAAGIVDALDMMLSPKRLVATLRS